MFRRLLSPKAFVEQTAPKPKVIRDFLAQTKMMRGYVSTSSEFCFSKPTFPLRGMLSLYPISVLSYFCARECGKGVVLEEILKVRCVFLSKAILFVCER